MQDIADVEPTGEDVVAQAARDGHLLIAESDSVAVGFVIHMPLDGYVYIAEIDVLPEFGGKGIGAALMAAVERAARASGAPGLSLATFRDVPWNGPWYAKFGFEPWPDAALGEGHLHHRANHFALGLDMTRRFFMRKLFADDAAA